MRRSRAPSQQFPLVPKEDIGKNFYLFNRYNGYFFNYLTYLRYILS